MKEDQKNLLKLQISTYLEESLSMVGRMMLEDLFEHIEVSNEQEAEAFVTAHYDGNIFELTGPYLQEAIDEYETYKATPEGKEALDELKRIMDETKQTAIVIDKIKTAKVGDGNVH